MITSLSSDAEIETERLILRPPKEEDFEGWAEMMDDEESSRFIGGRVGRAAAWRGMAGMAGSWFLKGFGMFSVLERSTGNWVGRLGPWQPEGWLGPEIGWGLKRSAWGKGYASEGASAAIEWAFDRLGWTEVIHSIDPLNAGSIAVAKRLGSYKKGSGTLPPPFEPLEVEIWGQTREEWRLQRGQLPLE